MAQTDALVIGAGIVGTSVALHLRQRGLSVVLVDRGSPGEGTSYGNSGVMTFLVNHTGTIFQKDLGESTARIASRMTTFNPDHTWKKVPVSDLNLQ